jgi:hypothetical protein
VIGATPQAPGRSGREGDNNSTPAGAGDILLRAGGNLIDTPFRIWLR